MLMPTIDRYMTRQPWTIRSDARLADAHRIMREHGVRHLPVLVDGQLVGLVSEGDVRLTQSLLGREAQDVTVEDAMSQDVFTVAGTGPVDEVVEQMAKRKIGSAVVVDRRGHVEGIFTTVDALQFFADTLRRMTA